MEIKYDNLIFIFLLVVVVIGISLAIAQPSQFGHSPQEIGPGEFYGGGDYIFPSSSDIGIGIYSPTEKLDVAGNIKASGVICDSNGCIGGDVFWTSDGAGNIYRSSGNVGIGTPTPGKPLSIQGTSGSSELIGLIDNGGTMEWHLNLKDDGLNFAETGVLDGRLFLKEGGNVGIGTTDPGQKLHVEGGNIVANDAGAGQQTFISRNAYINTYSSGADTYFYPRTWSMTGAKFGFKPNAAYIDSYLDNRPASLTPGPIEFKTGGTTQMTVAADGNVGINTSTPTATLDVDGDIKVGGGTAVAKIAHGSITSTHACGNTWQIYSTPVGTDWATTNTRVTITPHERAHGYSGGFGTLRYYAGEAYVDSSGDLQITIYCDYSAGSHTINIDYILLR